MNTQQTLDYLADNGILTSVCYGDSASQGRYFSIDICLTSKSLVLEMPQKATSFVHAVEVAYKEAIRLGWINEINDRR